MSEPVSEPAMALSSLSFTDDFVWLVMPHPFSFVAHLCSFANSTLALLLTADDKCAGCHITGGGKIKIR